MRIAFIYDRVNKLGGAERVLMALHQIWPQADLFTSIYNPYTASWARQFKIKSSFLSKFSLFSTHHEIFFPIIPYIFESVKMDDYDVILSITSAEAKAVIVKPGILHICYCLTPIRYLWSGYQDYFRQPGVGFLNPLVKLYMMVVFPSLRRWDYIASSRPDCYLAVSRTVAERIKVYYRKDSEVIYPPVDIDRFKPATDQSSKDYFLIVSRLVPYKRIDYVISTFNNLGWKLKIIGSGIDKSRLKLMAKNNIEIINGNLTDEKLCWYYQNCQALIFPGEEDFGITSVEAQACGKPVIGFKWGGVSEVIIPGITGEIYESQDEKALTLVLKKFKHKKYYPSACRQNAIRFAEDNFKKRMKKTVEDLWKEWKKATGE
ncbi:glycosyltransferase family 4 protein [Candidatus Gottesmanbacteria bacterium]|nr:glycosyltransferase family 4 protein [Candidatus Gottesmanbacteria bacterium]